ncbi:MAG: hypothetical protein ACLGIV_02550 [Actinomycetes bacterium]
MTLSHEAPVLRAPVPQPRAPAESRLPARRTGVSRRTKVAVAALGVGALGVTAGLTVATVSLADDVNALQDQVAALEFEVGQVRSDLVLGDSGYSMAREHTALRPAAGYALEREHQSLRP